MTAPQPHQQQPKEQHHPISIDTQHDDMIHDAQFDYYGCKLATCSSGESLVRGRASRHPRRDIEYVSCMPTMTANSFMFSNPPLILTFILKQIEQSRSLTW